MNTASRQASEVGRSCNENSLLTTLRGDAEGHACQAAASGAEGVGDRAEFLGGAGVGVGQDQRGALVAAFAEARVDLHLAQQRHAGAERPGEDRKSTRLNSSHVKIS